MNLFRPLAVFGIHRLTFVEMKDDCGNICSLFFLPDTGTHWKAGQHFVFWVPNMRPVIREQLRAFSVSSSPSEGVVRITTRNMGDTASVYKKRLFNLKPGDHIFAFGPLMWFYLKHNMPVHVGIAGGIGITPIRAIIKEMENEACDSAFTLFYMNAKNPIPFKEELDAISASHSNITIHYLMDPETLTKEMLVERVPRFAEAQYYISGSPGYIKAMERLVVGELHVPESQVVQDGFWDFRERFTNVTNALFRRR